MKRFLVLALALTMCTGILAGCRGMDNQQTTPSSPAATTPMSTTPAATTTAPQPAPTPAPSTPGATAGDDGMVPDNGSSDIMPGDNGSSGNSSSDGAGSMPGADGNNNGNRGRFRSHMG